MKYHSNELTLLNNTGNYEVSYGSFEIEDFSISSGQDPKGHIYKGLKKEWSDKSNAISFEIGRHGSSDVGKWFSDIIEPSQNTFDHNPGKLNFALYGTIILICAPRIDGMQGLSEKYTMSNVMIAQGHPHFSTNWWFGATYGKNVGNNTVQCSAGCSNGEWMDVYFKRGGNSVNLIEITKIAKPSGGIIFPQP